MKLFYSFSLILVAALLVMALPATQCNAADTGITQALASAAGDDVDASKDAIRLLAKSGPSIVPGLVDMLGGENDSKVRRVFHGVVVYIGAHGSSSEKRVFNRAICDQIERSEQVDSKLFLIQQLHIVGTDEAVRTLGTLLSSADLHEPARQALAAIGTRNAASVLRNSLVRSNPERKVGLIQALEFVNDTQSVSLLLDETKSTDTSVRYAAIQALGSLGDMRAESVIRSALYVGSPLARRVAADAYMKLAESHLRALRGIPFAKERAVEMYTRVLQASHEPAIRLIATNELKRLGVTQ